MSISGWTTATCDSCKCRFSIFTQEAWFFTNQRVVGTCGDCIDENTHQCYDELTLDRHGLPLHTGKKRFKDDKN